ncbi:M48 family metalloprotease [Qingshengfaniella alkalisoli]|uniref:M48 family metalloprotease n=1 Tax=Qingshengfaniella alkalisoli TaxID=2599296 RepID=A0A5B8ITS7_9RHOB|nr:M48 family metalloprotease [Qingshengfaniella alkalisoli]QDY68873.1 M48 family metalloprotease [Qingshengfaniella alkalisoli]
MLSSLIPAALSRLCLVASLLMMLSPAAQARSLLRDAGMEHGLNMMAQPLLVAAGLPANRTKVLVINDMSMNAFVVDSSHIFVNAGLILKARNAAELQAVFAHEIAHIANGHFSRRRLNAQSSRTVTGIGIALALAAGVGTNNAEVAAGLAAGAAGAAHSAFLAHTRAEEASADQSGMRYMARSGIDPRAMSQLLDHFEAQEAMSSVRRNPYTYSHPLSRDRKRAVADYAARLPDQDYDNTTADYWFGRAQGKLSAYLRSPGYTANRLAAGDDSDAALIQRSVAALVTPDYTAAQRYAAMLTARSPDDPYFHDLAGWVELESGRVDAAIAAYARAAELAPYEPLILAGYGRALMARNTAASRTQAREVLETARARDPFNARLLRDLATAYASEGENGMASVTTAERLALTGDLASAHVHAQRALGQLPTGSPGWNRAQDIARAAQSAGKRR